VKLRVSIAVALAAVLATVPALPAPASAAAPAESIYTRILYVYQSKGTITPCEFSGHQLEAALNALGTAGGQYFGDFIQAIQTALSARASGACSRGSGASSGSGSSGAGAPPSGTSGPPLPSISLTSSTGAGVPAPLIAIGVLAVALLVLSAVATFVGRSGIEPGWVVAGRHSLSEVGYRVAGSWEDFSDWLRSGRHPPPGGVSD
jgi:hypothetical protein